LEPKPHPASAAMMAPHRPRIRLDEVDVLRVAGDARRTILQLPSISLLKVALPRLERPECSNLLPALVSEIPRLRWKAAAFPSRLREPEVHSTRAKTRRPRPDAAQTFAAAHLTGRDPSNRIVTCHRESTKKPRCSI